MKIFSRCIDLKRSEIDYLESDSFLPSALLSYLRGAKWRSAYVALLDLPSEAAEELREAFTEQLAKVGFDDGYELTAEGRLLESLIDRFGYMHACDDRGLLPSGESDKDPWIDP